MPMKSNPVGIRRKVCTVFFIRLNQLQKYSGFSSLTDTFYWDFFLLNLRIDFHVKDEYVAQFKTKTEIRSK